MQRIKQDFKRQLKIIGFKGSRKIDVRYSPKCAISKAATSQICPRRSARPSVCSSRGAWATYSILRRLRGPNLTFGKLPLEKLHIGEVATWEIVTLEVVFGKMPLGKQRGYDVVKQRGYDVVKSRGYDVVKSRIPVLMSHCCLVHIKISCLFHVKLK